MLEALLFLRLAEGSRCGTEVGKFLFCCVSPIALLLLEFSGCALHGNVVDDLHVLGDFLISSLLDHTFGRGLLHNTGLEASNRMKCSFLHGLFPMKLMVSICRFDPFLFFSQVHDLFKIHG